MVRFTLFCRSKGNDMRMEFPREDRVSEMDDIIWDHFGNGVILRNGYSRLSPGEAMGDCISDGDRVEVIPDPERYFGMEALRRI